MITTQSILTLIVSNNSKSIASHSQSNSKELEKCALHNFLLSPQEIFAIHLFPSTSSMDLDHTDHPLAMVNWSQHTNHTFMKFVLQQQTDSFTQKLSYKQQVPNKPLAGSKKGIKREVTSDPTLKDERYFDSFSRSLYITAKSHNCDEVLHPDYKSSREDKELFENNRKISMIFPLVSCCSCVNNPSSS